MKYRVLLSAPYAMPAIEEYRTRLSAAGCEVIEAAAKERLEEPELLGLVGDVDGIICGDDRITARVLAAAPRLKVISKWGTGIDSIDREAASARGVEVRNTPGAFSEPVADTVFAWLLLWARKPDLTTRDMREGRWVKPQLWALGEQTLGIIGVGDCGKAVARRAAAFGMTILGNDLVGMPREFLEAVGIRMTSKEELLRESDYVTLHVDLNPASRHLMDAKAFALMKPAAYLANASRGPVVEEKALIRALEEKRIAGAGLDVFEEEPLPAGSPLRRLPNVWLSPHNANSSPRAQRRVHDSTIENLLRGLKAAAGR